MLLRRDACISANVKIRQLIRWSSLSAFVRVTRVNPLRSPLPVTLKRISIPAETARCARRNEFLRTALLARRFIFSRVNSTCANIMKTHQRNECVFLPALPHFIYQRNRHGLPLLARGRSH